MRARRWMHSIAIETPRMTMYGTPPKRIKPATAIAASAVHRTAPASPNRRIKGRLILSAPYRYDAGPSKE
jgi:hypothetical protein